MKNINVNVNRPPTNIPLGRQGENLATCVTFDCTGLVQLYGDGTAELLHELKSGTVYPVAIKQDGKSVSWTVSASDTATVGAGRAELRWYVGDTLAKSAKFRTSVSSALADSTTETPPEPQKSWVDKVLQAAQEIKDGAISGEQLADAIAKALADASASGEFDGAPGKDGTDGGYYAPSVDADGNLTWTASAENMPTVPGTNIKGPQGEAGSAGATAEQVAQIEKNTQDISSLSEDATQLKSDLDEVIATGFEVVSSYNRVNPDTINISKYVYNVNGVLYGNTAYNATDFITIEKDHVYAFVGNSTHWAVYNADKTCISRPTHSVINGYNVFAALEDGYIRFSYAYNDNRYAFVELNKETDASFIGYNIDTSIFYDNKIIEKETKEDFSTYLYNLMDASKIKVGYYGGTVNVSYDTTDWMELPSEPLTIYDKSLNIATARCVWYADRDFNQIYYQEVTSEILAETPTFAKAKYFRYSVSTGKLEHTMVFPSSITPFKFFEYGDKCLRKEYISPYLSASDAKVEALKGTNCLKISADMLTSNTSLKLDDFPSHLKKGIAITADMKFSAFSKVSIGKGYESYRGDWLEIDDTNVIYKHYEQSASTVSTVAHGLTINDSLSIALYIDNDGVCNVSLATNGGNTEFSIQWGYEQNGKPFVIGDQEMTEVNLSAIALDAKCPIWLFGDSYFGVAENRVIGQLKNLGYTDGVLVDGMAGIGTSSMLDDLQKLIALGGSPKIVICCEGMNDGGSGYASNINAIIGVCDGVGAELVLYKVPVVAKRITENTAVNTAMLATGKRYIDAYKAVGATDEGTWWDGYLNSDGVHPNKIGAKAIAQRILIDVPEIMQYGRKVGNVSGDISGDK